MHISTIDLYFSVNLLQSPTVVPYWWPGELPDVQIKKQKYDFQEWGGGMEIEKIFM